MSASELRQPLDLVRTIVADDTENTEIRITQQRVLKWNICSDARESLTFFISLEANVSPKRKEIPKENNTFLCSQTFRRGIYAYGSRLVAI